MPTTELGDPGDPRELLNTAEGLAPRPEDPTDRDQWIRYWTATGLAACAGFRRALSNHNQDAAIRGRELAYLSLLSVASVAAAVPLVSPEQHLELLWDLTPEAGALNGEWEDWLTETLDKYGINPADIDDRLVARDFSSPTRNET